VFDPYVPTLSVEEVTLPNGRRMEIRVVRHPGAVAIIPMLSEDRLIMLRQYRPTVGRWLVELPAGTLKPHESPEECARRELLEETGYEASDLTKLFEVFLAPGYSDELLHVYLARGLEFKGARPSPDEVIEVVEVSLDEALELVRRNVVRDAKTISALLYLAYVLPKGHL